MSFRDNYETDSARVRELLRHMTYEQLLYHAADEQVSRGRLIARTEEMGAYEDLACSYTTSDRLDLYRELSDRRVAINLLREQLSVARKALGFVIARANMFTKQSADVSTELAQAVSHPAREAMAELDKIG